MSPSTSADQAFNGYGDLAVPSEYSNYDDTADSETVVHLETWKRKAFTVLSSLRDHLRKQHDLDARTQAEVVWYISAFDEEEPWVLEDSRELARGAPPLTLPGTSG